MKSMSIKSLSLIILTLISIFGAFVIYSALTISRNTAAAEDFWVEYQDISSTRASAFKSIVKAMGYGGLVDHFKSYLLRKEPGRIDDIRISVGKALAAIEQYSEASIAPEERSALRDLRSVVQRYAGKLDAAQGMVREGYSSRQIERVSRVDDAPAIDAMAVLKTAVLGNKLQKSATPTRIDLLNDLHQLFGFGGLIHQFDDYLLRQEPAQVEAAQKSIAAIERAIDLYRSFSLVPAEDLALKSLSEVAASYREKLDAARQMVGEKLSPEEIEFKVRIDNAPAESALQILYIEIGKAIEASKQKTTAHLASTSSLSRNIVIGSGIGLALLMALIAHVLFSHILGPINRITDTLAKFIEGQLDIDFHGTERKDELGYLARVIDKMRVILINYALRQSAGATRG